MNIGMWIVYIVGGAIGVLSSLYCLLSIFIVIGAVVIGCIIWAIWFENRPNDKS